MQLVPLGLKTRSLIEPIPDECVELLSARYCLHNRDAQRNRGALLKIALYKSNVDIDIDILWSKFEWQKLSAVCCEIGSKREVDS